MVKPDIVIIDGPSQFYRAFHTLRTLINSKGFPTGAIYGMTNIIRKIIRELRPKYMCITWDPQKILRKEEFSEYKAKRETPSDIKVQFPYIKRIIRAFGIPYFEIEGLESDDVIASIKKRIREIEKEVGREFIIYIITADKDIMQLIDERTFVYDPREEIIYDERKVFGKFGVPPCKIPDFLSLVGDEADNIPGVKGIGERTAASLLSRYSSVEEIFENLKFLGRERELLLGRKDEVLFWKSLVKLKETHIDITLKDLGFREQIVDELIEIFSELEFSSWLKEFEPKSLSQNYKLSTVDEVLRMINEERDFSFDVETTSQDSLQAEIVGISFFFPSGIGLYLDLRKDKSPLIKIKDYLSVGKRIGHNLKYDLTVIKLNLEKMGLQFDFSTEGIFDTIILAYLLNPDREKLSLDELSLIYLKHKKISYSDVTFGKSINFKDVPVEKAVMYSCEDSEAAFKLFKKIYPIVKEKELENIYLVERDLIPVLMDMEICGIGVDVDFIREYGKELREEIENLKKEIYSLAGLRFNLDSPQQLSAVLFEKLKIPPLKRTEKKKSFSTSEEVLEELSSQYKIAELILKYRELRKILSTYIEPLPRYISNGRIHPKFNQTRTGTGRLSSSDPNVQNIPSGKIRRAFVPSPGKLFISADYSQIELRILAMITEDEKLSKAFHEKRDIHREVAFTLFGKEDEDLRRKAKTVNFGIIYGISPYGLKTQLKIEYEEAEKLIKSYFENYVKVREWREKVIEFAEKERFVRTAFGRLRYVPEILSQDKNERGEGERKAINTPIQGTAADIMKYAMIKIWKEIKGRGNIVLQIHDSLVVEAEENLADEISRILKSMEEIELPIGNTIFSIKNKIPLEVKIKVGKNLEEV